MGCAFFLVLIGLNPGTPAEFAIQDRINPNTAPAASLSRLEGIGPARAESIISYRQAAGKQPAFARPNDLQNIRGIGPKTVEKIQDELTFK